MSAHSSALLCVLALGALTACAPVSPPSSAVSVAAPAGPAPAASATTPFPLPAPLAPPGSFPVLRVRPGAEAAAVEDANLLLTTLLDTVGLYTLVGNLKPMSDVVPPGLRGPITPEKETALRPRYAAAVAALDSAHLRLRVLWRTHTRNPYATLFVLRTDLVREKILAHPAVFAREQIEPDTPAEELLLRLEALRFRDLHRVQGLLYGFPPYAVEFFCRAMARPGPTGMGQDRRAIRIPAYTHSVDFVYVIPLDQPLAPEDVALQRAAAEILQEYRRRRPAYEQSPGRLDAIRLLNDWYRDRARLRAARPPARPRAA